MESLQQKNNNINKKVNDENEEDSEGQGEEEAEGEGEGEEAKEDPNQIVVPDKKLVEQIYLMGFPIDLAEKALV